MESKMPKDEATMEQETRRERDRPIATKEAPPLPAKPPRTPFIGATVIIQLPSGGALPVIVNRFDQAGKITGLAICSDVTPSTARISAPYGPKTVNSWCWPDEV